MPGVKAILPTLRRRLSTGDIFKPARKLVKLSLHIRKDFITRVASKNVWVILAPSNGLIIIMNWFQKVSLNEMTGQMLTSHNYSEGGTYYETKKVKGPDGRLWKFMYDGSINCQRKEGRRKVAAGRDYSAELVSPI